MKKSIFLSLSLVFSAATAMLVINSCRKLTDGVTVYLTLPHALNPVTIQIVDASVTATSTPDNPVVQITGENASDVTNYLTKVDFTPQNGLLTLGLKQGATPTADKPYRFNVVVTADGYLPTVQSVVISEQKLQVMTIPMVNLKTPPASVSVTNGSFTVGAAAALQSPKIAVNVPAGTNMTDASGAALSGNIASTIVGFDIKSQEALSAFPGGFVQNKIKNANGVLVEGGVFSPIAFMALEMTATGGAVKKFSKPVAVSMVLPSGLKNEKTQSDLKEGDELGLYSMDKGGSVWSEQGTVKVVKDGNGALKVDFTTDHLSWFTITNLSPFCANGTTVKFSGFQRNENYYCIFTNRLTNQLLSTTTTPVSTDAAGNGIVQLRNMPFVSAYTARIFPNPIWTYGGIDLPPIAEIATPFVGCGGLVTATCANCQPRSGSVNLTIKIQCQGNSTNLETYLDAPIWFPLTTP